MQVRADGTYAYRPDSGYSGGDTFSFRVTDGRGVSSVAAVNVGVGSLGYVVEDAASFDGVNDSMSWTPAAAGDRRTWTFSSWVKWTPDGESQWLFGNRGGNSARANTSIYFDPQGRLALRWPDSGGTEHGFHRTSASYTDTGRYYHVVVAIDTTLADGGSRIRFWVDGEEVTSWDQATIPSQNDQTYVNQTVHHDLGVLTYSDGGPSGHLDGTLAETVFVDGEALGADAFGEFDATGAWVAKEPAVTDYGTNGFRLGYGDGANLGDDTSGNGNDLTANGPVQSTDGPPAGLHPIIESGTAGTTVSKARTWTTHLAAWQATMS